ncbi:MAG: AAA family ATPase [Proteobacteria bacterium]|nr:MAG: AAA family ATPase [Pseudomonadota bacterium]
MTNMQAEQASVLIDTIKTEIGRAVIGQKAVIHQTLLALIAGGNVLVEGVPGLGKTLLVRALAKTFEGQFSRIQFTPDLMPADVTGHTMVDLKSNEFNLRRGPIFTHLLLADEINRAPAKTQSALLEVMQERQVTIDGESHPVPLPFMTLATQNPLEQEGTYPLPEAQLDRFLLKIFIEYPEVDEETLMVAAVTNKQTGDQFNLSRVMTVAAPDDILALQSLAAHVQADQQVIDYAVQVVHATRNWQGLSLGAGPRGSISLIRAARAEALCHQRDFITPDDIKAVALPALRHRVALSPDMELEGHTTDQILESILQNIDAPRQ